MKSLKTIALITALATPLVYAKTSTIEQANTSFTISTNATLELSNVDIANNFPSMKQRRIPKNSKTKLTSPSDKKFPTLRSFATKSTTIQANLAPLTPHYLNCAVAYNLSENNLYTDSISVVGEQHCYIMPLSLESKVVGQLIAEDVTSDFNLYLYQYDEVLGTFTHVGSSEKAAGLLETTYAVLPQASYILVAELMSGTGGSIDFIGNSYSTYDTFEPNDSDVVSQIPTVTVGQVVTGNLDNPSDVDYFSLTSTETELRINVSGSPEHQIEILYNGQWQIIPLSTPISLNGDIDQTYYFRALAAPNTTPLALDNYQLRTSNGFARFDDYDLYSSDRNLTDLVSYDTEAFSHLNANGKAVDLNGFPVLGEEFNIVTYIGNKVVHEVVKTDIVGRFYISFDLPSCSGQGVYRNSNFGIPYDKWYIEYKGPYEVVAFPSSHPLTTRTLKYIHICDETLVEHVYK